MYLYTYPITLILHMVYLDWLLTVWRENRFLTTSATQLDRGKRLQEYEDTEMMDAN
jgi:hypothetical protein